MNLADIQQRMEKLDNWSIEGGREIVKDYEFDDFHSAIQFVNSVGEIAEKNNHHPTVFIDYRHVRLALTTHEEHGLSDKDFAVAEEIDRIGK